ncbi:MAG: hypothetical protein OEV51_01735 [Nitrospira sp.]|nr:hypothetical protein [Nitrospira sp.]
MAVSLKEGRTIHGAEAVAERPDGSRIWFTPPRGSGARVAHH